MGISFRAALQTEKPLQIVGAINAYSAILAKSAGYRAIYLSGAGVANASYGLPDLGMTNLEEVLEDARRITSVVDLPLLVDVDTGWGDAVAIGRTVKEMIRANVAAIHIEDQVSTKRCGHRLGKAIVTQDDMVDRIKAAVDAKTDPDFIIMARTDAVAIEGMASAIERACRYVEAGADMIFPEALSSLEDYQQFVTAVGVPVLANITEFGNTPLLTIEELERVGVAMALYPLTAFRAMSAAALDVYKTVRAEGTQKSLLDKLQTREELYQYLDYEKYEKQMDQVLVGKK
jgi:methylisocitrate lyase